MVTGKSQPGAEPVQLSTTSPDPIPSNSPPSKRDLASWWRQFKRNTRKDEIKGTFARVQELEARATAMSGACSRLPDMTYQPPARRESPWSS